MGRATIVNVVFKLMAAFWAVIVITKAQTPIPWHAYALAALGVVAISTVGTRLKRRIRNRIQGSRSKAASRP
jgi:uncharacterized membrane protein YfcA